MVVAPSITWLFVRISPLEVSHHPGACRLGALVAQVRVDVDQTRVDL